MKQCFKCGAVKALSDFYPHPRMADGHLNKCKECTKRDVASRYRAVPALRAEYEKKRFRSQHRKHLLSGYQREGRRRNPEKHLARLAVSKAIRSGELSRQPCQVCGDTTKVEAHHEDYSRPLDVRWLCFRHHRESHGQTVIFQRATGQLVTHRGARPVPSRERVRPPPPLLTLSSPGAELMRKTICPTCQSTELVEVKMQSGPHYAKLVCRHKHFVQWLPMPRDETTEVPADLLPLVVRRPKPVSLKGSEKQVAAARSLRLNMIDFANRAGRDDYVRLLACVEDASWFLANRGKFPPQIKWPSPHQMAKAEGAGAAR